MWSEANWKIDSQIEERFIRIQFVENREEEKIMFVVAKENGSNDFSDFIQWNSMVWGWLDTTLITENVFTAELSFDMF